jgi:hypothetical protein
LWDFTHDCNTVTAAAAANAPGIFPIIVKGINYPAGVFPDGEYVGDPSISNPQTMLTMKDEELMALVRTNSRVGAGVPQWALDELQFRFVERMQKSAANILTSSDSLGQLILDLTDATKDVHREVSLLNSSSDRMEHHTITLKRFTVALIVFAVIQIVIAGVQTWKMFQNDPAIQTVLVLGHPEPWR